MSSEVIVLVALVVLIGFSALKGTNPLDSTIRGFIWLLYRFAAFSLTIARTADCSYLALRREYRRTVKQIGDEREAFLSVEEARITAVGMPKHATTSIDRRTFNVAGSHAAQN
jgi:hypothetical protein